jgi:hypothetical protein
LDEAIHFTLKLSLALSEYTPICLEHYGYNFVSNSAKRHLPAQRNERNDADNKYRSIR